VPERGIGNGGKVLEVAGVVVAHVDAPLAPGQHGTADVEMGGEDGEVAAVVEAVEQAAGQRCLDQVDACPVR
jgi:hypothetical protein